MSTALAHPDLMYQREGQIEHWYATRDQNPAFRVMQRSLAEHALEQLNSFTLTVATMLAENKSEAEIGAMARKVAEEWQAEHIEAISNCGR